MITECRPTSEIKFQVLIMTPDNSEAGVSFRRLTNICGQDLAEIIETATKEPGTEVAVKRQK